MLILLSESPSQDSGGGDDTISLAESSRSYGASVSSVAGGMPEGGTLDITGASELGMPEDDVAESDVSVGREEGGCGMGRWVWFI